MTGTWAPSPADRPDAELLARIRKVLALTNNPNEHEASVATRMTHDLLAKHQLSMLDVLAEGGAQEDVGDFVADGITSPWQRRLLRVLAEYNYCATMYSKTGTRRIEMVVGRPSNVNTVQAIYQFVVPQLERLCLVEYMTYKATPLPPRPMCDKCDVLVDKSEWSVIGKPGKFEPCWECPECSDSWRIDDPPSPYGPLLSVRAFRRNFMEGAAQRIGNDLYEQLTEAERKAHIDAILGRRGSADPTATADSKALVRTSADLMRIFDDENKKYISSIFGELVHTKTRYREESFVQHRGTQRAGEVSLRPRSGLRESRGLVSGQR